MRGRVCLILLALLILVLSAVGCTSDGSDGASTIGPANDPIALTQHGSCGEAYLWAATADGSIAVTATVAGRDRATDRPTTWTFDEPDGEVTVELLRGDDLPRNFCTDVIDMASEPRSTLGAVAARGRIRLDPPTAGAAGGCGVEGELRLDELRGPDDERFEPLTFTDDGIGCYSG